MSRLTDGAAIIKVGGSTEIEIKEKYDRIDDALSATRAAISDGIVPGGGLTLFLISEYLKRHMPDDILNDKNICTVYTGFLDVISAPMFKIFENANIDNIDGIFDKLINKNSKFVLGSDKSSENMVGYNIITDSICNFVKAGIIDPAKVTKTALANAVSVANTFASTECLITDVKDKK